MWKRYLIQGNEIKSLPVREEMVAPQKEIDKKQKKEERER
jgi:hypothetical protein